MMLPVPVSRSFTCMKERQFPLETLAKSCTVYSLLFHSTATPRRRSMALIPMVARSLVVSVSRSVINRKELSDHRQPTTDHSHCPHGDSNPSYRREKPVS